MSPWWPVAGLTLIVAAVLAAERRPRSARLFRWLPSPLWCYVLPAAAVGLGWLPRGGLEPSPYRLLTDRLLPVALGLLLIGVDVPAVARVGARSLLAAAAGAAGIVVGIPIAFWIAQPFLPPESWRGAGALAGTWTGGTMNLLALRAILGTPEAMFAPLILVDALVAYGWMALLVAASSLQRPINRWLRAVEDSHDAAIPALSDPSPGRRRRALGFCAALALALAWCARGAADRLPSVPLVGTASGWTVLLVTTAALALSLVPTIRRIGQAGSRLGAPCLYLVLAATGAQARIDALWSSPAWLAVGLGALLLHGTALVLMGRLFRIPLAILATASQANVGGVVSAPLVGAVYHRALAPVGLLLAVAGNALGTHLGLLSASLCHILSNKH